MSQGINSLAAFWESAKYQTLKMSNAAPYRHL